MLKFLGTLATVALSSSLSLASVATQPDLAKPVAMEVSTVAKAAVVDAAINNGLNWKVGDKTTHKMSGGLINGSSVTFVREAVETGYWLQQDLDLGMLGKHKVEILLNKNTGAIEKLKMDGQDQQVPATEIDVLEMKESHIKVIAGEFDAVYVKVNEKKSNQISEAWINPKLVPMSGTLKQVSDSQLGKITQELTAFEFGK